MRWITLNTETVAGGDQAKWLESELASQAASTRWLVAQYHQPAYPAVKIPSHALQHWVPLFEKYHVDLVCEGDGHAIKRTPPIRGNKVHADGVVYIGEGGLGVLQRTPKLDRWFLQSPGKAGQGHHVQLLTFDREKLTYRVILLGGKVWDEHVLAPRKRHHTAPVVTEP